LTHINLDKEKNLPNILKIYFKLSPTSKQKVVKQKETAQPNIAESELGTAQQQLVLLYCPVLIDRKPDNQPTRQKVKTTKKTFISN
jgi:hypothetical protein